jgi:hypothetical protein
MVRRVMLRRAFGLMQAAWRVMWAEQSLLLLAVAPVLTFAAIVLFEATVASISPLAAVALLVPAAVAVVCTSMFWSAAIVAAADDVADGRSPTVARAVRRAAARLGAVCGWAFYSLTVGVAIRLLGSLVGRFAAFLTYAGETAWSAATMLVLPAIVLDGASPQEAVRRSRERFGDTWDVRVAGQVGFDVVALLLASPALAFVFAAALVDNGPLLGIALLACFASFIGAALLTSACLSVYRTMLHRALHGRPVPAAFLVALQDVRGASNLVAPAAARASIGSGSRPLRSR